MPSPPASIPPDLKSRLATSYNAIAPAYNTFSKIHDSLRTTYIQKLLSALPPPQNSLSALELGCGACGPGTQLLLSHGFKVTGNDISSAQLELARKGNEAWKERLELVQGDMMALEFAEGEFDAVVAFYSIIHLPRDEQVTLVRRIAKWIKPGGLFLANFAEEESEGSVMEEWLGEKGWMYWSAWGGEKSVEIVKEAGFEVLIKELVRDEDGTDADFVWVLARKGEGV